MIKQVPSVTFKTRVRDESIEGSNPFKWQDVTTQEIFGNKKVVVFSLPGAFTPTCSTFQLPGFENNADKHHISEYIDTETGKPIEPAVARDTYKYYIISKIYERVEI